MLSEVWVAKSGSQMISIKQTRFRQITLWSLTKWSNNQESHKHHQLSSHHGEEWSIYHPPGHPWLVIFHEIVHPLAVIKRLHKNMHLGEMIEDESQVAMENVQ